MTAIVPNSRPEWIAVPGGAIASEWLGPPSGSATGCLIVPSVGHEETSMHPGLVELAHRLAERHTVVMLQHWGTDQSDGSVDDSDLMRRWHTGIEVAVATMRARGIEHITVIATRLGALITVGALPLAGVERLVLWSAITSGRRFVRELRIMRAAGGATAEVASLNVGGYRYPATMLDELAASRAAGRSVPAHEVLVIDHDERPTDPAYVSDLRSQGATVTECRVDDISAWADRSIDDTELPRASIEHIDAWIALPPSGRPDTSAPHAAVWAPTPTANENHEQFCVVTSNGLHAVRAMPPLPHRPLGMVLYSTVGPGRSFVELARNEANRGRLSIRFDAASTRWSPPRPFPRPTYQSDRIDLDAIRQCADEVVALGAAGSVLVGFCGGSLGLLRDRALADTRAVVAINPPLFDLAMNPDRPARDHTASRSRIIRRFAYAYRFIVWRVAVAHQLRSLAGRGIRVLFLFDDDDLGYLFWRKSLARTMRRHTERRDIVVVAQPGLGHNLEGAANSEVLQIIADFVSEVEVRYERADRLVH
jgi:hypothetical protein